LQESFVERLILSVLTLFGRQWSQWEILTISLAALFVLVWMTKQQRDRKVRSKYNKNQFVDSSPLIGLKLGAHNKSRHIVNNFKNDRLAPVQKHQNKQQIQTKEPLKKPHEEIKQLQNQTTEHKQTKTHFEQQVSELTADNEKLQRELAKFEQAESQNKQHLQTKEFLEKLQEEIKLLQNETFNHKQAKIRFEQQVSELTTHNEILQRELDKSKQAESQNKQHIQTLEKLHEENKQLQNEITEHRQAKVSFEQQVSELTADNEKLQRELDKSKQVESQNKQHIQTLEKLHEEIKQLQNEITEHKQAKVSFEQQVSELTAENEKLQSALVRFEQAEQQIAEMTAACESLQTEDSQSEQQILAEPAVEVPVKSKTAGRSKTYEQQHRTADGVRQKLCRKCKEWKPESEFHKNSSSRDGLAGYCKICKNNAARKCRKQRKAANR
jgi:chromosome segregation ATPase